MTINQRKAPTILQGLTTPKLDPVEGRILLDILYHACGLRISEEKLDFVRARLARRLRSLGCASFADYLSRLRGPDGAEEKQRFVEALTTHTTGFFREVAHFSWLDEVALPELVAAGVGRTRALVFWSAACSIGAELWSAAMMIDRFAEARVPDLRWEAVGTDISRPILRRAASAVFTGEEIEGIPDPFRRSYLLRALKPLDGAAAWPLYRIAPELRARARFQSANLLNRTSLPRIEADIVFLRNILIYFTENDQSEVVRNVAARMTPGAYLLTGHSERVGQQSGLLERESPSIYRRC